MNGKRAFTLIELMIVIGIISLLMGMLLPLLGIAKRSANRTATQAVMHKVDTAARLFRSEMEAYPYQLAYTDPWSNRLGRTLGGRIADADLAKVRADAATAEAAYAYDCSKPGGGAQENPATLSTFAFRRSDIHPNWYWDGSTYRNIRDNSNSTWPVNPNDRLAMAAMLNRLAGELARLEVFAGDVDVTGLRIQDAHTMAGALYFAGRDNSAIPLLGAGGGQSRTRPGWAEDYLHGEIEARYRDGDAILDSYGQPLVFISQVHEGGRFARTYMFQSVVYSCDLRTYGMHRRGRSSLAPVDPLSGAALAAGPGLPDPANPRHSDRRTWAAPGYEGDFEIWSAGPDRAFDWMRDDPRNQDNIPCSSYDRALP